MVREGAGLGYLDMVLEGAGLGYLDMVLEGAGLGSTLDPIRSLLAFLRGGA